MQTQRARQQQVAAAPVLQRHGHAEARPSSGVPGSLMEAAVRSERVGLVDAYTLSL